MIIFKKLNVPIALRIAAAVWALGTITVSFCDFAGLTGRIVPGAVNLQFVPALLRGSFWVVIFLVVITAVFGRIYCSVFCPLGILQDVAARFPRYRGKSKRRYGFAKPHNAVRFTVLAVVILSLATGTTVLSLFDPYSNFGRIATSVFRPVVVGINNVLSNVCEFFGNYDVYRVTLHTVELWSAMAAVLIFIVVLATAYINGRLLCNTVCPVGTVLGLLSRFSPFTIKIDGRKCTGCKLCETVCKSKCIDGVGRKVDGSRCVMCLNCMRVCRRGGIGYGLRVTDYETMIIGKQLKANVEVSGPAGEAKRFVVNDRRKFLFATASLAVSLPVVSVPLGRICDGFRRTPLTPPGSHSLERFKNHCTACHLCVTHCPQQILKPAALEFGLGYLFKPHLSFYETGYCNYGCTVCSEVCPAGAILRLTEREKMAVQIGVAEFDRSRCVVYTDLTSCGACAEHCPTLAVRMVDYVDGLTVPEVTEDLCIGCGACESICPVRPLKAINVRPHLVHRTALVSDDEQLREIDGGELDFGF